MSPGEVPSPEEAEQLLSQQSMEETVDGVGADTVSQSVSTFQCACLRLQLVVGVPLGMCVAS